MDLTRDRKIVIMIPHSDDELLGTLSVINRHPNKNNIYSIVLSNEYLIRKLVNKQPSTFHYGTYELNKFVEEFGIDKTHNIKLFRTLNIVEQTFNLLSLINPDEIYCPAKEDTHKDHLMMYNIIMEIQPILGFKVYTYLVHYDKEAKPKPNYTIELTPKEKKLKEDLIGLIYPNIKTIPKFMNMGMKDREEFYDA